MLYRKRWAEFMSSKSWTVMNTPHLINLCIKSNNNQWSISICASCFSWEKSEPVSRGSLSISSRNTFSVRMLNLAAVWHFTASRSECATVSLPLCSVCGKLQHRSAAGLFQLVSCANVSGCGRVFLVLSCSMRCRSHTGSSFLWGN